VEKNNLIKFPLKLFSQKREQTDAIMLVQKVRAITIGSNNRSYMLRAITVRSDNYSGEYKNVMQ
jgi:hypothetical protein